MDVVLEAPIPLAVGMHQQNEPALIEQLVALLAWFGSLNCRDRERYPCSWELQLAGGTELAKRLVPQQVIACQRTAVVAPGGGKIPENLGFL